MTSREGASPSRIPAAYVSSEPSTSSISRCSPISTSIAFCTFPPADLGRSPRAPLCGRSSRGGMTSVRCRTDSIRGMAEPPPPQAFLPARLTPRLYFGFAHALPVHGPRGPRPARGVAGRLLLPPAAHRGRPPGHARLHHQLHPRRLVPGVPPRAAHAASRAPRRQGPGRVVDGGRERRRRRTSGWSGYSGMAWAGAMALATPALDRRTRPFGAALGAGAARSAAARRPFHRQPVRRGGLRCDARRQQAPPVLLPSRSSTACTRICTWRPSASRP